MNTYVARTYKEIDGKTKQCYGQDLQKIQAWANKIADTFKTTVKIYALEERLLSTIEP